MNLTLCLEKLLKGKEWSCIENDYDSIFIKDGTPKPSLQELEDTWLLVQAEELQAQINQEALAYLASTDWYVVRFSETGVDIPDDVKAKRQEARDAIK